jgi:hypothetical protein
MIAATEYDRTQGVRAMTDPMSPEAQAARARKARHNLATAATEKMPFASALAEALASVQQVPLTRAQLTESVVPVTETGEDLA